MYLVLGTTKLCYAVRAAVLENQGSLILTIGAVGKHDYEAVVVVGRTTIVDGRRSIVLRVLVTAMQTLLMSITRLAPGQSPVPGSLPHTYNPVRLPIRTGNGGFNIPLPERDLSRGKRENNERFGFIQKS